MRFRVSRSWPSEVEICCLKGEEFRVLRRGHVKQNRPVNLNSCKGV